MADQDFNIKIVTTADTSGIRQTGAGLSDLQQKSKQITEQQAKDAQQAGYELGKSLRVALGAGVIGGGYKFVSQLREAANEIEKISHELDKQGQQLVENAQRFSEMAKFATSSADVIKIGEGALKGVEQAHKRLLEVSGQELSIWQKIADVWAAGFKDKGPIQQVLDLQKEQAQQNYQLEREQAIREIIAAQRTKDALAAKDYAGQVDYLNSKIKEQEDIQKRVGVQNLEDYLKAGSAAENYRKILDGIISDEERRAAAEKRAAAEAERAERDRERAAEKEFEAKRKFQENAVLGSSNQTKAVIQNEEAARKAREVGNEKDADLYQKSADQLKASMTQAQRDEYEQLTKTGPVGRKADTGESQSAVDAIERNRINYERQLQGQSPLKQGEGGSESVVKALQDNTGKLEELLSIWR